MQKISGHFFILVQPHDDKWFKPAAEQRTEAETIWVSVPQTVLDVGGKSVFIKILTLDIQVRASGKCSAPCSTRCRATSPWSASSYNLRSYTGGSSHALNIKEKVPLHHSFSTYGLHTLNEWLPSHLQPSDLPPSQQQHTQTPTLHGVSHILCKHIPHDLGADLAHIQFLGKPTGEEAELRLKSSSTSINGTLLFNKITQPQFYVTPSVFPLYIF